jgi:outer membrane lipoprotein-sorting protein
MKYLRTVSTHRLLATLAGLVIAAAGGTAIAVAASGAGPVPVRSGLARALREAISARTVTGISARITFTDNLIDTSVLQGTGQGSDPILTGATGRLWLSSDHQLRLELQSSNGDAQVLVSNGSFWISDPSSNTVYEGTLPQDKGTSKAGATKQETLPSIAQIQSDLNSLMGHADISGAIPSDVAGQAAYTVRISAKHDGGLLGSAALAWDAARGVPLRFAIYARGNSTPVLQLAATDISYGPVRASDFAISPPAGAKVVKISTPGNGTAAGHAARTEPRAKLKAHHSQASVSGVAAVARRLPFALVAPNTLVGLPRQTVQLLDWAGKPAALVTYGQNLGGVAVIEQAPSPDATNSQSSGQGGGGSLSLPTVSIHGATGQELDTALGTVVRFTRRGVAYTVLGSVPAVAADAAARAL